MKRELGRIRFVVLGAVFVVCILAYLVVFRPMENAIRENKRNSFAHSAEAVGYTTELFLENCMSNARNLSSSAALKQRIVEYKTGTITLEDLKEHTKASYEDGYDAMEDAVGAFRVVDGSVVARQGRVDLTRADSNTVFREVTPFIDPVSLSVTVYSPIQDGGEILGYDVVFFDMSGVLHGVHQGHMLHEIYSESDVKRTLWGNNWTELKEDEYLVTGEDVTWYIKRCKNTEVYFAASSPNDIVYGIINSFWGKLFFSFPFMILIIILGINTLTFENIGRIVKGLERARDKYRKEAITDNLTGTFSRNYFNEYIGKYGRDFFSGPSTVVMIDVNDFKAINDTYGHLLGDAVLEEISAELKSSVREEDIVVRYGGDEFLLLLKDCDINKAEKILTRTAERIRNIDKFDFSVEISYGVMEVSGKEGLLSAVQQADKSMYEMKRNKSAPALHRQA